MAKLVVVVDDFDRETPATETLLFAFDGSDYSLDLSADNAKAFREAIAPYVDAATKLGKHQVQLKGAYRATTTVMPTGRDGRPWYRQDPRGDKRTEDAKKRYRGWARKWAQENGYQLGERGIIPQDAYDAYEEYRRSQGMTVGPESVLS